MKRLVLIAIMAAGCASTHTFNYKGVDYQMDDRNGNHVEKTERVLNEVEVEWPQQGKDEEDKLMTQCEVLQSALSNPPHYSGDGVSATEVLEPDAEQVCDAYAAESRARRARDKALREKKLREQGIRIGSSTGEDLKGWR